MTPTRRLSLGNLVLPVDPAPGLGGVLLAAIVANYVTQVDEDLHPDLDRLIGQVGREERITQPRLRHRFQIDRHGLARSLHRMVKDDEAVRPDLTAGDAIPAGHEHDWNLGPTGARGWMFCDRMVTTDARQIAITKVAAGSPADGVLAVGDVLLGAGGAPFARDPRTELGMAITAAEAKAGGGALRLTRWRCSPAATPRTDRCCSAKRAGRRTTAAMGCRRGTTAT